MRSLSPPAVGSQSARGFGIGELLEQLPLGVWAPTTLYLRFEPLVRLHEGARGGRVGGHAPLLGVFVSWKFESIRRGDVDQLIVLDEAKGRALMFACRQAGLRIVDNTELKAAS